MRAKTNTQPAVIYRFFNTETGKCITESEAKKLPPNAVFAEAIRIPNKNASLLKPEWVAAEEKQPTSHHRLTNTVTHFFNRFKRAFAMAHETKKEHPLFEVHKSF